MAKQPSTYGAAVKQANLAAESLAGAGLGQAARRAHAWFEAATHILHQCMDHKAHAHSGFFYNAAMLRQLSDLSACWEHWPEREATCILNNGLWSGQSALEIMLRICTTVRMALEHGTAPKDDWVIDPAGVAAARWRKTTFNLLQNQALKGVTPQDCHAAFTPLLLNFKREWIIAEERAAAAKTANVMGRRAEKVKARAPARHPDRRIGGETAIRAIRMIVKNAGMARDEIARRLGLSDGHTGKILADLTRDPAWAVNNGRGYRPTELGKGAATGAISSRVAL